MAAIRLYISTVLWQTRQHHVSDSEKNYDIWLNWRHWKQIENFTIIGENIFMYKVLKKDDFFYLLVSIFRIFSLSQIPKTWYSPFWARVSSCINLGLSFEFTGWIWDFPQNSEKVQFLEFFSRCQINMAIRDGIWNKYKDFFLIYTWIFYLWSLSLNLFLQCVAGVWETHIIGEILTCTSWLQTIFCYM